MSKILVCTKCGKEVSVANNTKRDGFVCKECKETQNVEPKVEPKVEEKVEPKVEEKLRLKQYRYKVAPKNRTYFMGKWYNSGEDIYSNTDLDTYVKKGNLIKVE